MSPLPPKQLSMVIDEATVDRLPDVPLPAGYVIRACRPGDTASWARRAPGGRIRKLGRGTGTGIPGERRAAERFARRRVGGRIVAATFATRISNRTPMTDVGDFDPLEEGALDYVVTHPEHRGRGLGRATCTEVSRFLVARGYKTVSLGTDDWRLPAIHVYLSMGFRPVMNRNDMSARWAAIYKKLKESGRDYS